MPVNPHFTFSNSNLKPRNEFTKSFEMDRDWMSANRLTVKYREGVDFFLEFSAKNADNPDLVHCPCLKCGNMERMKIFQIREHLFKNGIDRSYKVWYHHGKKIRRSGEGTSRKDKIVPVCQVKLVTGYGFVYLKPVTTMEDLLLKASNLTVLDEDGWEINKDGGAVAGGHCAKARLCSNRPMSRNLLKTILGRVWGIADNKWGVEIKYNTKDSSFLVFSFKSSQDLNRILSKNHWFLNHGTLILAWMESLPQDWEQKLLRFPISGRVLHLPSRSITQRNLVRLASLAGETNKDTLDVGMDKRKETMKAGYISGKRDGSWREISDPLNGSTNIDSAIVFNMLQMERGKNGSDLNNVTLVDVSISYVDSLDKIGKAEGSSKRRRVTPLKWWNSDHRPILLEAHLQEKGSLFRKKWGSRFHYEHAWADIEDCQNIVLGIIPILSQPDWLSWSLNKNVLYSVARGYKLRFLDPNIAGCSNNTQLKTWWQFIWSSKLIPKMKNFIWRVFNQWIPTKVELTKR
ncbi:hypothetical protein G4B88_008544, partial [Cannabis sativa]